MMIDYADLINDDTLANLYASWGHAYVNQLVDVCSLAKKQQGAYAEAQATFERLCQTDPSSAEAAFQASNVTG